MVGMGCRLTHPNPVTHTYTHQQSCPCETCQSREHHRRAKEQTQRDMKAAIEMMREGLPHNTLEVGGRLFVLQNRRS